MTETEMANIYTTVYEDLLVKLTLQKAEMVPTYNTVQKFGVSKILKKKKNLVFYSARMH